MLQLVISDLHEPFSHPNALDFLSDLRKEYRPEIVIATGDEIDGHGWSRYGKLPDAPGQREELRSAVKNLKRLYKLFPKVLVCNSNHKDRSFRAAIRAGLPSAFLKEYAEVLEAPKGWIWSDRHISDGVAFIHGEGYSGKDAAYTAAITHRMPTVIGHIHSWAGVQYQNNSMDTIWGMNVGCLVDPESYGMQYAKKNANAQILGAGVVLHGVPHFIPMRV